MLLRSVLEEIVSSLPALLVFRADVSSEEALNLANNYALQCDEGMAWFYLQSDTLLETEKDKSFRLGFDTVSGELKYVQKRMEVIDNGDKKLRWFYL